MLQLKAEEQLNKSNSKKVHSIDALRRDTTTDNNEGKAQSFKEQVREVLDSFYKEVGSDLVKFQTGVGMA